jgi:IS30 family transposase
MRSPGRPPVWQSESLCRFWQAVAVGRTIEDAARDAGVSAPVGVRWFRGAGGMPPTHLAPSAKSTSGRYLRFPEREEIAIELSKGIGIRAIARKLGRSPSTVSREVRRNAVTRGGSLDYRASTAQWHADRVSRRPRPSKLVTNPALRSYIQDRLAGTITSSEGVGFSGPDAVWKGRRAVHRQSRRWSKAWSLEQIANRLRIDFPEDPTMRISHEAIYQALYIQERGALRHELTTCLRSGRALRMPRERARNRGKSFIGEAIMISQRSSEVGTELSRDIGKALILGLGSSAIGTLVERTTRLTMLLQLPRMEGYQYGKGIKNGPALAGHGAQAARDAITRSMVSFPEQMRQSLTWDQGTSMPCCGSTRVCRSISVILKAPGNGVQVKTQTACCGSTFPRAPTSAGTPRTKSMRSLTP